jgi:hypothetical protein
MWRDWRVRLAAAAIAVVTVVLIVDRGLASVAAQRLARQVACVADLPNAPRVRFGGALFTLDAMRGQFDQIVVEIDELPRDQVTARRVRAVLAGVTTPAGLLRGEPGPHDIRIDSAEITAVIDLASIVPPGRPVSLSATEDGLLAAATTATLQGQTLPVTLYARPALMDDQLVSVPEEVEVLGLRLGNEALLERVAGTVDLSRPLPALPDGLGYTAVAVDGEGLRLRIDGADITAIVASPNGTTDEKGACGR